MEEKHLVKRAIIMAAGVGSRMQPLTLKTPKPLVKVNGTAMIDTVVDALQANGIREIYLVVGYLKEQFESWSKDKPFIQLIENPYYDSCNNISSLYVAREYLGDCIILDGDQIIYNPQILKPEFVRSGYNAIWTDSHTDEWLMEVKDGIVRSCSRTGGSNGWQLYSVSRWTMEDGMRLRKHLEMEFEAGNRDIYWDDLAMFCHFEDYQLGIYPMQKGDMIEVDSLQELAELDKSYEKWEEV
ncbi:NTP transferase domain-containing protein [Butyrivibrio sp. MC2013]|uniref:NTP transferase domain-containing protein n=1 Tax=Butyrivibrio sp. MC2013 TaxID=1280686 RepID=UPI0003FA746F|nr:NTP transferase domain-containing protein [Butyrivibrio sp. MC2013]